MFNNAHSGVVQTRPSAAGRAERGDAVVCDVAALARYLVDDVVRSYPAGFTVDPRARVMPTFHDQDYLVSLWGHERRVEGDRAADVVHAWLESRSAWLGIAGLFVGGWLNPEDRLLYLDLTIVVRGLATARRVGRQNHQLSIYHPENHRTIWLAEPPIAIAADARAARALGHVA